MYSTDLKKGVVGELGTKAPARVATMVNIDLEGLQTVNGVELQENDIVLVNTQDDKTENGIYLSSTGEWQRVVWFDDELDAVPGTMITTNEGSQYSKTLWRTLCDDFPIQFGTSEIEFEVVSTGNNTGDVTLAGEDYLTLSGQQITALKIALTNMANLAANSIIGNNTGGAASPIALTVSQVTAMLNDMIGDSGSGGSKGLVPAPAAGDAAALKFLKADGTWQVTPSASQATETVAGIAEIATQAEVNARTDDLRFVTSLKIGNGFVFSTSSNGYIKFPSWLGGFILQWGQENSSTSGSGTINFPAVFPTACQIVLTANNQSSSGVGHFVATSWNTTNFSYQSTTTISDRRWFAIGS